jgi:hypothetical protein
MAPDKHETQQGVTAPPFTLLSTKRITKLTDAAMYLFNTLTDVERDSKQAAKANLKAEMDKLDLFPAEPENHEDYVPGGEAT